MLVKYLEWVNPEVYQVPLSYAIPMSFAVSTIGSWFQVIVGIDSCFDKNKLQIWAQCITQLCLAAALAIQYSHIENAKSRIVNGYDMHGTPFAGDKDTFWALARPANIACMVTGFVTSVAICVLAVRLHIEFTWSAYQLLSSDVQMRKRYRHYQVRVPQA